MPDQQDGKLDFLTPIGGPELVFGLVGPIGTELRLVSNVLAEELRAVQYKAVHVHVTDLLREIDHDFALEERPLENKYRSYMDAGNKLRKILERADAFALLAVAAIQKNRFLLTTDRRAPSHRTAYILNQFKRPEEIETLRRVYGRGFIQISAYCSKQIRLDTLTRRISESHFREKTEDSYRSTAYDLMVRDAVEEEMEFGQRVRDTFPLGDVIIDADNEPSIRTTCGRFIRAFFGDNFVAPTIDEYGAYAARTSALRSSDLSRQVGAACLTSAGEIISNGCNEVPKSYGRILVTA